MDAGQRRQKILEILNKNSQPVSAGTIAAEFHVSRQIIVGDIALLRAANVAISATPRGYILQENTNDGEFIHTIACKHSREDLLQELYTIVDNGGGLIDVIVEHPVYGQISGQLHIFSRYDADAFVEKLAKYDASPLLNLTNGVHLHTISCQSEEAYKRILSELQARGFLFEK